MAEPDVEIPEMTTGVCMTDAAPDQDQSQTQSQTQSLLVSIQSSSDAGLERRIFTEIASSGRQLGRISDVLAILLDAYRVDHTPDADQQKALTDFDQMRTQIAEAREARNADRIIEGLEALRSEDRASFDKIINKISEWKAEEG